MNMGIESKTTKLVKAVSELKEEDYSREPELNSIYARLSDGRKKFAEIFEKNIKAVMQISSLDLMMQHQTERIMDISRDVARATETIFGNAGTGSSNNQHEELTNTIVEVSTQTQEVYEKIEKSQQELTTIKELSNQTIQTSWEMQKDLDELLAVINRMNNVVAGIDDISMQTNLLALNASIEAARAGSAGKGFAVVANEIRELAGETQKLTQSMGELVDSIKGASQKSAKSASSTIDALGTMTEKIENIWELNSENQSNVSNVNESVSSIASVSEEISDSMTKMENQLRDSTDFMQNVSQDLKKAAEPVVDIEKTLDETVKQMGTMTEDAFFHLKNSEFASYVNNAISAHHTWLSNLEKMVREKKVMPLQLDSSKCGFGHFYYALTPKIPGILPIWEALGSKHMKFHKFGEDVIAALNSEDYFRAEQIYGAAEHYSKELIADLENMLQIAGSGIDGKRIEYPQ